MTLIGGGGSPSSIYILNGIFMGITWVLVAARCYVRHFLLSAFSKEDALAILSLIGYTIQCAFNIMIGARGSGTHMIDLTPQERADGLMWWWAVEEVYIPTSVLVKASVACVCLRLLEKRSHIIGLYMYLGVVVAYSVVFFFLNMFQCHPPDLFWKKLLGADTTNKCMDLSFVGNLQLAYSAVNAVADIFLSVLSCSLVYKLHLPTGGYKASVFVVLSFGVLACCAVLIRLPFLVSLKIGLEDFMYYTTHVVNWSTVELGLGIIAAAGSSLRPLVRTIVSRSRFIGTSIDPTSTRWKRPRDQEGYIRSGAAPPTRSEAGFHSRLTSVEEVGKFEMFPPKTARSGISKAGRFLDLDLKQERNF